VKKVLERLPKYRGEVPTESELNARRESIHKRQEKALGKVDKLMRTQAELGAALDTELTNMREHQGTLTELERRESDDSLLGALIRRFSSRQAILGRKSVAEGLLKQYELTSMRLRQATAFSDELRLVALELQEQVDKLHQGRVESGGNHRTAAQRVLQLELELEKIEGGGYDLTDNERARQIDALTFQLRRESLNMELFRAAGQLATDGLDPTRALRDTVMELHEGMAGYVMQAGSAVDAAGRKIQALGMAADAPVVVGELQESLAQLGSAMEVTQTYVEQTQELLHRVLPDLSTRVADEIENRNLLLTSTLENVSREKARLDADYALKNAADAEVEAWLAEDVDKTL
jgi:hypothetical protein